MSKEDAGPELQLDQDLRFEHRDWTVQRVAWAALSLLVAAGLLGLFGTGWLSEATAGEPGGAVWVEYERFARWHAPEKLRVHLGPGRARDGVVSFSVDRSFLEIHEIRQVMPRPAAVEAHGDRYAFVFRAPDPDGEMAVTFDLQPESWGRNTTTIAAEGTALTFTRVVYP